jgi:hypothetical protein
MNSVPNSSNNTQMQHVFDDPFQELVNNSLSKEKSPSSHNFTNNSKTPTQGLTRDFQNELLAPSKPPRTKK